MRRWLGWVVVGASVACGPTTSSSTEEPSNNAIDLTSVRLPDVARPLRYRVHLDVDPDVSTFDGEIEIDVHVTRPTETVWLNASNLTIERAEMLVGDVVNPLAVETIDAQRIALTANASLSGEMTLKLIYRGTQDDERTEGLYRVAEPDGARYSYTMFEPMMARRVFPCFDEPTYKVPWQLTFDVQSETKVFTNTPMVSETIHEDGHRTVVFAETPPYPSYLIAFMVGAFDVVDAGAVAQAQVPMRFILPPDRREELGYAEQAMPRIVESLESFIGVPFPVDKLDVAVVPRYWGTMEHPGIVALGQPLTLIRPEQDTLQRRMDFSNIAIHELCHYWYGDLVTNDWWDDIWLNESFGTWCDQEVTQRFEPSWSYERQIARGREEALRADALPSAKRIREPAIDQDTIESSFDGSITYAKGAAIIRMFEHWIGSDAFRATMADYLTQYRWKTATSDDLTQALNTRHAGLGDAMRTFTDQVGAPTIAMQVDCADDGSSQVHVRQQLYQPLGVASSGESPLWSVPVCVRYGTPEGGPQRQCELVTESEHTIALADACPTWWVGNADGVGYYRTTYDSVTQRLVQQAEQAKVLTQVEHLVTINDVRASVAAGTDDIKIALDRVPALARSNDRELVMAGVRILSEIRDMVPDDQQEAYRRLIRKHFAKRVRALGWRVKPNESADDTLLRAELLPFVAITGEEPALIRQAQSFAKAYLAKPASVPPEVVEPALAIAAVHADEAWFDRVVEAARASEDHLERQRLLTPLGYVRDPALLKRALAIVASSDFDLRDTRNILFPATRWEQNRPIVWAFITEHFETLGQRMTGLYVPILIRPAAIFCDEDGLSVAESFYTGRLEAFPGTNRTLRNQLNRVRQCIAFRDKHHEAVDAYFR